MTANLNLMAKLLPHEYSESGEHRPFDLKLQKSSAGDVRRENCVLRPNFIYAYVMTPDVHPTR